MAEELGAVAVLSGDPYLVPSTDKAAHNHL